ncbi:PQQ-binding-like beta-propeller repeat protein [Paenarthrobacter sp. AR 02]|uniref:PQQ-binding-like beta-propeller repeat protein n=1 Tax=Paenarthrobacter sp. AR 02 TaxID=2899821 RepID=UPI001F328F73|nr:PQQ-binding-like beta-propeller repeat protein [Paenarthrobacter sp. AR 02]MCF3137990.1 PQQ-binding-like beta-propeller repeat protein [Paenarthrobacter sp. AR 02]
MTSSLTSRPFALIKSVGLAVTAVAVVIFLASCTLIPLPKMTSAPKAPPSAELLKRSNNATVAAWEVPLDPIGQPVVADGVAVVYGKTSGGITAYAFSAADGKQLWTNPVHPGLGAPGIPLEPALTTTDSGSAAAVFLMPAGTPAENFGMAWWTTPVAVELKTGRVVYRGDSQLIETRPTACENKKDMCFTAFDPKAQLSRQHRVSLATAQDDSGDTLNPLSGNYRLVGESLYSVVENGIESIARVHEGKKVWSADIQEVFGRGATTNLGWNFQYSEKLDLYVGSVGLNPTGENDYDLLKDKQFSVKLTDQQAVGFQASTGKVLWTAKSAHVWCANLVGTASSKLNGSGDGLPVRCEYTQGSMEYPSGKLANAKAKAVGYDPLSGMAAWQTEAVDVEYENQPLVPASNRGDAVLAETPGGVKLVDTRNGISRDVAASEVFLCLKDTQYALPPNGPYADMPRGDTGMGSTVSFPCNGTGKIAPSLTIGTLQDINTTDNGMAVVSLETKISGYRLQQTAGIDAGTRNRGTTP